MVQIQTKSTTFKDGKPRHDIVLYKHAIKRIQLEDIHDRTIFEILLPEACSRSEISFALAVRSSLQSHTDIGE